MCCASVAAIGRWDRGGVTSTAPTEEPTAPSLTAGKLSLRDPGETKAVATGSGEGGHCRRPGSGLSANSSQSRCC